MDLRWLVPVTTIATIAERFWTRGAVSVNLGGVTAANVASVLALAFVAADRARTADGLAAS